MSGEAEHLHSCSRHGSIVAEWQREDPSIQPHSQQQIASFSTSGAGAMGVDRSDNSSRALGGDGDAAATSAVTSGDNKSVPRIESQSSSTSAGAASNNTASATCQLTPSACVPYKIVGLILFNPTISIDDDTTEANILFSERRHGTWGGGKDPVPHAVPNHAGLCSGFRMLASIFCASSSEYRKRQQAAKQMFFAAAGEKSCDAAKSSSKPAAAAAAEQPVASEIHNVLSSSEFGKLPHLAGVRYVTQVSGVHAFIEIEPEFPVVVTVERAPHHASRDPAIVDEITNWVQVYCDSLRVLHSPLAKLLNDSLRQQREVVLQAVEQNNLKLSKKKIESQARVAAAREVCAKVAPLFHNLYSFLVDALNSQYGGPYFLSHVQQQVSKFTGASSSSGVPSPVSTNNSSVPDFGSGGDKNNNKNNAAAATASPPPPQQQQLQHQQPAQPIPLFGPLQIAPAPPELRMCAAVLCSRLLDAHMSLLRHAMVIEAAGVLSPQSMCTLSPVILSGSLPPFAASALLGAAGLFRPAAANAAAGGSPTMTAVVSHEHHHHDQQHPQSSSGNNGANVPIETQLLSARHGSCRFLRMVRLKGDGSSEVPLWASQRGIRCVGTPMPATVTSAIEKGKLASEAALKKTTTANNNNDAAASASSNDHHHASSMDTSEFEKTELWLFQLGPHLIVVCEVKSSLLSVPGSRLNLAQNMASFLDDSASVDLLVLADLHYGGGGASCSSPQRAAGSSSPTVTGGASFANAAAGLLSARAAASKSSSSSSSQSPHSSPRRGGGGGFYSHLQNRGGASNDGARD